MSLKIAEEELIERITGFKRHKEQKEMLLRKGIKFTETRSGKPIVLELELANKLTSSKNDELLEDEQPNFEALS